MTGTSGGRLVGVISRSEYNSETAIGRGNISAYNVKTSGVFSEKSQIKG